MQTSNGKTATLESTPVTSQVIPAEMKDTLLKDLEKDLMKAVIEGNKAQEKEIKGKIKALTAPAKEQRELKPVVKLGEYKNRAVLELLPWENASSWDGRMSFGVQKARLIVACFAEIKKFAESK